MAQKFAFEKAEGESAYRLLDTKLRMNCLWKLRKKGMEHFEEK